MKARQFPTSDLEGRTRFGGLTRSQLMSRVRSKGNATTELRMIQLLRSMKLRGWRRNYPLPGNPDFVWAHAKLVLFVDGCFWHGHACGRNLKPRRNAELWEQKIEENKRRDRRVTRLLRSEGWTVVRVWECQLRKHPFNWARHIMTGKIADRPCTPLPPR